MAVRLLTVICAWCHRTVTQGPADAPVTHTICASCMEWTIARGSNPDAFVDVDTPAGQLLPPPGYFGDLG